MEIVFKLLGVFNDKNTDAMTERGFFAGVNATIAAPLALFLPSLLPYLCSHETQHEKKQFILAECYSKTSWQTDDAFSCASYLLCLSCPFQ